MAETPSGKDKLLRYARVFVGGYNISGDFRTFGNFANSFEAADMGGVGEELVHYLSDGHRIVGISGFRCLMNDNTNRSMDLLDTADALTEVSVLFGGGGEPAIPDPCYFLPAAQMKAITSFDGGAGVVEADFLYDTLSYANAASNPAGVVLANADLTATADLGSHGVAALTTAGWHANLHVTATAAGNYAMIIEHGTDDAGWATLGTFVSTAGAVGSEYLTGTGTVNKFVRFAVTKTAGTATVIVAFARN